MIPDLTITQMQNNLKTEEWSQGGRGPARGPLLQLGSPAESGVQDLQEQLVAR